jgi:hypothetical protein
MQRDELLAAFRDDRGPSPDAVARIRKRLDELGPVQERARVIELPTRRMDRRVRIAVAVAALAAAVVLGWWIRGVTLTPAEAVHGSLAEDRVVEGDTSQGVAKDRGQARVASTPEPVVREIEAPAIEPAWTTEPSIAASPRVATPRGKPSRSRAAPVPAEEVAPVEDPPAAEPLRDTLAAETAIVHRARAELSRGRAQSALTILVEHGEQFPGGALVEEAAAVRTMAKCRLDPSNAARLGTAFVDRFPKSLFRSQVDAACRPAEKTDGG